MNQQSLDMFDVSERFPDSLKEALEWCDCDFPKYMAEQERFYGSRANFPRWLKSEMEVRIDVLVEREYWLAWLNMPPDTDRQTAIDICKKVTQALRKKLEGV